MGMAASQVRFLSLTARKNNVEFEGQQINQQRVALSNQSAAVNQKFINLNPPIPPDKTDFTTIQYSFLDGAGRTCMITNLLYLDNPPNPNVNYKIDYEYSRTTNGEIRALDNSVQPMRREQVGGNYNYFTTLSNGTEVQLQLETDADVLNELRPLTPYGNGGEQFYYYTDADGQKTWISQTRLNNPPGSSGLTWDPPTGGNGTTYTENGDMFQKSYGTVMEEVDDAYVYIEIGADGRLHTITINGVERPLSVNSTTDDQAYNSAMAQYAFDKAQYDKNIADANAKISVIQAQDKKLEIQLKQLDTEQEAIQTELEAVQKVIQKNTEGSFKTFA